MSSSAVTTITPPAGGFAAAVSATWRWRSAPAAAAAAVLVIIAVAAALRLIDLGAVPMDPFYDAAVRSMGLSLHNFFFGAYEPGGSVSIDKPPVDLWLQVLSVKLLGFGSIALKLPEALAGTLRCRALRRGAARVRALAGVAAAAALAVLPIEVHHGAQRHDGRRDDAAASCSRCGCAVRAARAGARAGCCAAAAALGVAFNVKLFESLVALPGAARCSRLAGAARDPRRRRLRLLAAAAPCTSRSRCRG